ncbi:MAG: gluconokinase [Calothrix sp. CSU_2_0]|nr:gluconokinase [Calothrix sp. CSU_2_0]
MIIIVLGVSGSGKTTIGELLAKSLNWDFQDADSFHPSSNINKMRQGIPLTDADRIPWLATLEIAIREWLQKKQNVVLACSALKAKYREYLLVDRELVKLVYLQGNFDVISQRLSQRKNHFMSEKLLQSQFDVIEEPIDAIKVDISGSTTEILEQILQQFKDITVFNRFI